MFRILSFLTLLIACGFITQCKSPKHAGHIPSYNIPTYEVYRIDSVSDFYLVYAKLGNSRYEIVSEKALDRNCDYKIKLGESYPLLLHSQWEHVTSSQQPEDSIIIRPNNEEGFYDLYSTPNLIGLCYCEKCN